MLAQTLERVALLNDLMGHGGRSKHVGPEVGLSVHLTAPKIDPGFNGTITLEIANMGPAKVQLGSRRKTSPHSLCCLNSGSLLDAADLYGADESDIFQYQSDPIPRDRR